MPRQKKNSARVNVIISVSLHVLAVLVLVVWAAREGHLGIKLKEIAVVIVPKEKPPEPPKEEKPPEPKIDPPKEETTKPLEPPKTVEAPAPKPVEPGPAPKGGGEAAPVAPAPVIPADFAFDDGAKLVETSTNAPAAFYKNFVEYTLRSNWERPEGLADDNFAAEVQIRVDSSGTVAGYTWIKGSGDKRWDDSVKKALAATKTIGRLPPKDFPRQFSVRFDVLAATEPIAQ